MGLNWSEPQPLSEAWDQIPRKQGVYRLWDEIDHPPLRYIGQSANLRSRLYNHRRNRDPEIKFSFAPLSGKHDKLFKRKEIEEELIGAYWIGIREATLENTD